MQKISDPANENLAINNIQTTRQGCWDVIGPSLSLLQKMLLPGLKCCG